MAQCVCVSLCHVTLMFAGSRGIAETTCHWVDAVTLNKQQATSTSNPVVMQFVAAKHCCHVCIHDVQGAVYHWTISTGYSLAEATNLCVAQPERTLFHLQEWVRMLHDSSKQARTFYYVVVQLF